ncbi:MAG: hypothetical protein AB3N19_15500 [Ruegeria sp.]
MSTIRGAIVQLTGGNVRNSHFYLRDMPWLPQDVIGGANVEEKANRSLSVHFSSGQSVLTDIAGDKMILRERSAVREFFNAIDASEGTRIVVELTSPYELSVSKR